MGDSPLLEDLKSTALEQSAKEQYRLPLLIAGAVGIAFILVVVALNLYDRGTAAQLDLSRPGYQSVREQAGKNVDIKKFSASGELSAEVFDSFDREYSEQINSITKLDAFGGKALTDAALGLPEINE